MEVQFYAKMKLEKGKSYELYKCIERYNANVIDLGTEDVYIHGKVSYPSFSAVLYECLNFGIVEVEIRTERS